MSKKKVAKLGLTAAVAATTFVAANPADAASVSQAEQAVKKAEQNARGLVKFYSSEDLKVSAEFTASYNNVRKLISDAKAQLANYKGKDKSQLAAILASAENHQAAAARYIDAVGILNGKLVESTKAVSAYIKSQELNADTVAAYDTLSAEIKKAEAVIGKVRGAQIREAFKDSFLLDAKLTREALIYEVSQYQLLNQIDEKLKAEKVDFKEVQADFAKLERLKERAVDIKKAGKELYPDRDDVYPTHTAIEQQLRKSEVDAKEAYVAKLAPVVESVSAINAKELKVTFNKAVSTNSVAVGDFTVTATGTNTANAVVDFKLAEDGKSAILLLTNAVPAAGVDVEIADGAILTSGFDKFPKFTTKAVKVEDTTAPKLVSAVAKDSTTVELTFDEQVDWTTNSGGVSVNGAALVAGVNSAKAGNYTYTFTVPTLKSGANTVQVLNYADFSANKEALTTTSVNYSADVSTPAVASIKAEDSNSFILTLNKAVDTIANTNFTVKKGNYTFTSTDLVVSYVDADGNPSVPATKYVKVVVPTQANTANPLYATNETSVALSVAVSGYKNGTVIGNEYTGSVTLSKDLTAPKVVSSKLITYDKGTNKIVVPFDKTLTLADANKLTVVSGNVKVAATPTVNGKNLEITITDLAGLTNGTYSLVLDKGLVKDASNNVNEATTVTTEVTNTASTLQKTGAIFGTTAVNDNGKNVITVAYGTKVDDAAASTSSYSLNGAALPSGSVAYFTTSAKDTVKIELPASYSVALNDVSAKITLNANAVKEYSTGYVVSSSATEVKAIDQVITLKDNVAPTASKVEYVKDANGLATGLKLTFSEAVDTSSATADFTNDFVIKTGSTEIAYAVAAPSTGDTATDNVVILNFSNASTAASGVTVATNSDRSLVDLTDISGYNKVASFNVSAQ